MANGKRSSFFGMPTLGGKLAFVNANLWVIFFLLARSDVIPDWAGGIVTGCLLVIALPIGILVLLPGGGPPSVTKIVWIATVLGVNAFLWGYGLAWCYEKGKRLFVRKTE